MKYVKKARRMTRSTTKLQPVQLPPKFKPKKKKKVKKDSFIYQNLIKARAAFKAKLLAKALNKKKTITIVQQQPIEIQKVKFKKPRPRTKSQAALPSHKLRNDKVQGINRQSLRALTGLIKDMNIQGSGDYFPIFGDQLSNMYFVDLYRQFQLLSKQYDSKAETLQKRMAVVLLEIKEIPGQTILTDMVMLLTVLGKFIKIQRVKSFAQFLERSREIQEYMQESLQLGIGSLLNSALEKQIIKLLTWRAARIVLA